MFANIASVLACMLAGATLVLHLQGSTETPPAAASELSRTAEGASPQGRLPVALPGADPRPALSASSSPAADVDLAPLRTRLAELERQQADLLDALDRLRTSRAPLADLDTYEAEDVVAEVEAEMQAAREADEAHAEELALDAMDAFDVAAPSAWSDSTGRWLRTGFGDGSAASVECRGALCRVELDADDPDSLAEAELALSMLLGRDDSPVAPMLSTVNERGLPTYFFERRDSRP